MLELSMGRNDLRQKHTDKRIKSFERLLAALQIFFIGFSALLILYLFIVQIIDTGKYRVMAREQRVHNNTAMRGDIYDRNGIKLATDKVNIEIYAHPKTYDSTPEELAKKLSPILKIPYGQLVTMLKKPGPIITLKKDADKNMQKEVRKLGLREISTGEKHSRIYPQGNMAAHILGYYNSAADIASGVEYTQKDKLEHVEHAIRYRRTLDGKVIYDFMTDPVAATLNPKGEDITLTIDAAIQHVCEKELQKMIAERSAERGVAIVMNPKNGEILAFAVYPTYDPNNFRAASETQLKNWSLSDVFPPGSTFKTITVSSAMELGKINEFTKILDTGRMKIGNWTIENYDVANHPNPGMISLEYLFEHSSNVGSVNVARTMSSREFYDMLKKFGFGQKSGIDLPGESAGLLAPPHKWDTGLHATMGYGYGTSVSAMQMVTAVSAIANNGVRVTPHVIKYSEEELDKKVHSTQVLSPETAMTITRLLAESVNNGKSVIKMDKYNVAAKTGTSGKPNSGGGYSRSLLYTSTIGFLPATDPQVLIYVCVDSAKGGYVFGNTVAGPVFHEIAEQVARILNLKPDKGMPFPKPPVTTDKDKKSR